VDRRQEFHAEGRLEAFHELDDAIEASAGLRIPGEDRHRVLDRSGHELELLVGCIAAIGVSADEVPLDVLQDVPQILGVGPVGRLLVAKTEPLAGLLREVQELVDLQERDEGVHQTCEVAVHEADQDRTPGRHLRDHGRLGHESGHRRPRGLEHEHMDLLQGCEGAFDPGPDIGPVESTEATAERRDRYRADLQALDLNDERCQTRLDVLHSTLSPPVALGREVHDVAWIYEPAGLDDQHPPRLDLLALAGLFIGAKVIGKCAAELGRDPPSHEAHAVDGVDERLGISLEDIAV
jgi:hypothetical protein